MSDKHVCSMKRKREQFEQAEVDFRLRKLQYEMKKIEREESDLRVKPDIVTVAIKDLLGSDLMQTLLKKHPAVGNELHRRLSEITQ